MKIVVTGAAGNCGTALADLTGDVLHTDVRPHPLLPSDRFAFLDINKQGEVRELLEGQDAVVHLAAASAVDSSWEAVLDHNIHGTRVVLEAAADAGVDTVVYASSNHVVGMYEIDAAPRIYRPAHGVRIDHRVPPRPDSYYGVSKLFGENLGRWMAERGAFRFCALRIGAVRSAIDDHPFAYAEQGVQDGRWVRDSEDYREQEGRLKALWQSRRDFRLMVQLILDSRQWEDRFEVYYGTSDNARGWLDLDHARRQLGYVPMDRAEDWTLERVFEMFGAGCEES